jgi:hypothetical protein
VELKRKEDGDTDAEPNFYDWEPDVVTFAA